MSLQFIFGNSGAGKSFRLYKTIIEESMKYPDRNYLVVVPEQFTMQTQKDLCMMHPRRGIMNIDVLSFARLAHRVFEEMGCNTKGVLDDEGKNLILRRIASDYEGELKILGGNLKKQGYISEVKSVISEFTQYGISFELLDKFMETLEPNSYLYYKLQDIRKVYEGFEQYIENQYITKEELLDVLSDAVPHCELLKTSVVALDGFTGFTPVQKRLLGELMGACKKVIITAVMDKRENPYMYRHPYQLFGLSKQMVTALVKIANERRIEIEEATHLYNKPVYRFKENEVLGFLESELFRYSKHFYKKEQDALTLYVARTPRQEADLVASKIRGLVREKGFMYRDIAVIASDLSTYAASLEKAFDNYNIAMFMDHKKSILLNAFVEYLRSLLAMADQNFSYDSVFRFLRTGAGMTGLTQSQVDILENYVLALGIKGYNSWFTMWVRRTRDMDDEALAHLNGLRQRFTVQIEVLMHVLKKRSKTVKEMTVAVYEYLVEQKIQDRLKYLETELQKAGDLALAKEYAQIYRIVIELFDKFVELLGDEKMSLKGYCELLDAGLEEAKVGVIPPSVDQVVVGDLERTRLKDIKALFFVGANDSLLSGRSGQGGILSERDRERFAGEKINLSPSAKEKTYIQKFYLYMNLTKPTQYLSISFSKTSLEGKTLRPAYLIQDMRRLYPLLPIIEEDSTDLMERELTPKTAMNYLAQGIGERLDGLSREWKELYSWHVEQGCDVTKVLDGAFHKKYERKLTRQVAEKMYGDSAKFSVTRLERFASCAYAHFLTYGLHLSDRELYQFEAMDMGNIVHRSMERFSQKADAKELPWTCMEEAVRNRFIEESVEESIADYGNTVLYSTSRNEYLITRIKKLMHRSVWALTEQLKKGDFVPCGYEMEFGSGKIDRIDTCQDENSIYVKVTDYKTGLKSFGITPFYHGLQLQLPVYLNAAMAIEKKKYPTQDIQPAGIFYYRMWDPIVDKVKDEQLLENKLLRELRLDGLVNAKEKVIEHLERGLSGTSNRIPISKNKDGSLRKSARTLEPDEFMTLLDYTKRKEVELKEGILSGQVHPLPYELGDETGCSYCDYRVVCGFDVGFVGCQYRKLEKMDKDYAIYKMRERGKEEDSDGDTMDEGTAAGDYS